MFQYIKYFFYLAFNWNVKIAWHIILKEIKGEKKYAINTTGADELKKLVKKGIDISHATIYMPVSYSLLEEIFEHLNSPNLQPAASSFQPLTHLLDLGSGKGRVLCVAVHYGIMQVTGIDLSKELCDSARENLSITKQKFPSFGYTIINNDAFYYAIPTGVDSIFLFNPFDEIIMSGVVCNIRSSIEKYQRKVSVIYVNPLHKSLFTNAGFKEVFYSKKMKYLEVSILETGN